MVQNGSGKYKCETIAPSFSFVEGQLSTLEHLSPEIRSTPLIDHNFGDKYTQQSLEVHCVSNDY